jgi:hypothetical protein
MAYLALPQLTEDDQYAYWLQVQSAGDPANLIGEVRASSAEIDGNLPILQVKTISEQTEGLIDTQKLVLQLSSFFSLLKLTLSCLRLYGVMTYRVVRRTRSVERADQTGEDVLIGCWKVLKT